MAINEPERESRESRESQERGERPPNQFGSFRARGPALTVVVDDRGIEAALRVFKKLVMKEGLLKDIKRHEHYEKPGDRKRRKTRETIRRRRRQAARTKGRFGDGQ
jgi:small subunit ribosomal protein S21